MFAHVQSRTDTAGEGGGAVPASASRHCFHMAAAAAAAARYEQWTDSHETSARHKQHHGQARRTPSWSGQSQTGSRRGKKVGKDASRPEPRPSDRRIPQSKFRSPTLHKSGVNGQRGAKRRRLLDLQAQTRARSLFSSSRGRGSGGILVVLTPAGTHMSSFLFFSFT
jgi:hypothetical protein